MAMPGALAALADEICDHQGAPLLLATGRDQGEALATDLRVRGFRVMRRAVYAAVPVTALSDVARQALAAGDVTAALFFSAETARHCVLLIRRARLHEAVRTVDALAIGQPAAVALKVLPMASHPRRRTAYPGCHAGAAAMTEPEPPALPPPETPEDPAPPPSPQHAARRDRLAWLSGAGFLILAAAVIWVWLDPVP